MSETPKSKFVFRISDLLSSLLIIGVNDAVLSQFRRDWRNALAYPLGSRELSFFLVSVLVAFGATYLGARLCTFRKIESLWWRCTLIAAIDALLLLFVLFLFQ